MITVHLLKSFWEISYADSEEYQGKGIGKLLIQRVIYELKS